MIFLVCSCQKENGSPKVKSGTSDIRTFVVTEIAKYGGMDKTTSLPLERTQISYRYSQDKDGFQVFCDGDRVADFAAMLQTLYGSPKLARTNNAGNFVFNYSIDQIGVALDCGMDLESDGGVEKKLTHLLVVKASALH